MSSLSGKCDSFTAALEANTVLHARPAATPLVVTEVFDC